jgi:cytochrome b pre-mRNA-processing protein 3
MPFLISLPLPRPRLPDDSQPERSFTPWRHALLLGLLVVVVVLILWLRALTAEQRAINNMEPQARAKLFQETWQGVQTLCQPQMDSTLVSRCRQEARFLLKFPECDESCRRFLDPFAYPTR